MSDARTPDGDRDGDRVGDRDGTWLDADLGAAFRQADAEARPRPEFRDGLRRRFVAGDISPLGDATPPGKDASRVLSLPRWILYPAAAAVLAAAFALSGALDGRAPVDPVVPVPEGLRVPEAALHAAEMRVRGVPALSAEPWQHRVVEGRPWLLPASAAAVDGKELRVLGAYMAEAETALARNLPGIAARPAPPVVVLVAPTRAVFEALVAPLTAPEEVGTWTVAFALRDPGVLLLSPEALAPGGPPCESMYVVHEAAHAWLHARSAPGARLPLWADEGLAGAASATDYDARGWCAQMLALGRKENLEAVTPAEVLSVQAFGEVARLVASRACRPEEPYALVPLFYAHAEGLVLFLTDGEERGRRAAFLRWLGDRLDGKPTDPAATAKDLGFADIEALFAARDAWLGL